MYEANGTGMSSEEDKFASSAMAHSHKSWQRMTNHMRPNKIMKPVKSSERGILFDHAGKASHH
jgi:hypothetical protein